MITQSFPDPGPPDPISERLLRLEKDHPDLIYPAANLDAIPKLVAQPLPVFPSSLVGQVPSGTAVVAFLVDTDGHVRLPRIMATTNIAFGYAAVQAISEWIFDPPTLHGQPAVAQVAMPVSFGGQTAKAATPGGGVPKG